MIQRVVTAMDSATPSHLLLLLLLLLLPVSVSPLPLLSLRQAPLPLFPPPGQLAVRHRLERHIGPGAAAVLPPVPVSQEDGTLAAVALGVLQFRLGTGRPGGLRTIPRLLLVLYRLPRRLPRSSRCSRVVVPSHAGDDGGRQRLGGRGTRWRLARLARSQRQGTGTGRRGGGAGSQRRRLRRSSSRSRRSSGRSGRRSLCDH